MSPDNRITDERLEELLKNSALPNSSPGFAQRIILSARTLPQQKAAPKLWESIQRLFAQSRLPHPAFALASVAIIGLFLGLSVPQDSGGSETLYVQDFLYDTETVL